MKNTLVIFSGPTASGKTDLAIRWARVWQCPILSADSRQVFKSVNIGTAKPHAGLLQEIPHYFIDHVELDQSYSVGQYAAEAESVIRNLFQLHERIIL
ncbi:MAG TPA: isopentenyl transferase family protein, partial [Saprospiraceae bacterium]|nr:isopentenyl transferase family protein [Saprospiraceae bacterium]